MRKQIKDPLMDCSSENKEINLKLEKIMETLYELVNLFNSEKKSTESTELQRVFAAKQRTSVLTNNLLSIYSLLLKIKHNKIYRQRMLEKKRTTDDDNSDFLYLINKMND